MDCDEGAVDQDLVRGPVGAGIGGPVSNSALVVVAVLRDDRGKAAQIVPKQEPQPGSLQVPILLFDA